MAGLRSRAGLLSCILLVFVSVIFSINISTADATGFYVSSTTPGNGDVQFPSDGTLSIIFSKSVNDEITFDYPNDFFLNLTMEPDSLIGEPDSIWLSEDKTTVFVQNLHLESNQSYLMIINKAVSQDGDTLDAPYVMTFTTGDALPSATISGNVELSDGGNPVGTLIMLMDGPIFEDQGMPAAGLVSAEGGSYNVSYIPPGVYWPVALHGFVIDEHGDINPDINSYAGIYDADGNMTQDSVVIEEGTNLENINFVLSKLFEATARQNYDAVLTIAQQWASDAKLVAVVSPDVNSTGESLFWGYGFYSLSEDSINGYMALGELVIPTLPMEISDIEPVEIPAEWIDSDVVLDSAEANGGSGFRELYSGGSVETFAMLGYVFPFFSDSDENDGNELLKISGDLHAWEKLPQKLVHDISRNLETPNPYWFVMYQGYSDSSYSEFPFFAIVDAITGEVYGKVTAKEAEANAAIAATEWAPDATLLGILSLGFGDGLTIDGKASLWICLYNSQAYDSSLAFITLNSIVLGPQSGLDMSLPAFISVPENWLNSDAIMTIAETNGGSEYRNTYGEGMIGAMMAPGIYMNNPLLTVWQIIYYSDWAEPLLMTLDAVTGEVLSGLSVTAAEAADAAQDTAMAWANDAVLSGILTGPGESLSAEGTCVSWDVRYFSASLRRSLHVYTRGTDVYMTLPYLEPDPVKKQELPEGWIDSDSAVVIAGQNGGLLFFVSHAPVHLTAELNYGLYQEESNRAVWMLNFEALDDSLLMIIDAVTGEAIITDVTETLQNNLPTQFRLLPNYPNPFNPETVIHYELPEQAQVKLTIYNLLGQSVRTLVNEIKPTGYYQVKWDGLNGKSRPSPSGVYLCRMETPSYRSVIKMMLIR
ncbi:T9SS type A sorting domain-containing protein [candidate division KSB1 bacterium]|nr:T9SS type A sorting domain-containing protein [candidate division KSB1 bacterium]